MPTRRSERTHSAAWCPAGGRRPILQAPALNYEVADPVQDLTSVGAPDRGQIDLLADAVFESWFAHRSPSTSLGGRYDIAGALPSFSPGC